MRLFIFFLILINSNFILAKDINYFRFYYGIGGHPNNYSNSSSQYIDLIKGLGFNSFRTDYYWSNVERNKDVFTVPKDKYQTVIDSLSSQGIRPLLILGYDNPIYFRGKPKTSTQIEYFANYSKWVCDQFHSVNPILQIWNEWSIDHKEQKSARSYQSAVKYYDLVKAVSLKIKGKCTIIAGDFNLTIPDDYKWGRYLIELGIDKYIDGISLHMYNFKPLKVPDPRVNLKYLTEFHDYLRSHDVSLGIYITEIGLPTYNWTKYSPKDVAIYARNFIRLAENTGFIKGVWWYDLIDDGDDKNNGEFNYGIFNHQGKDKGYSLEYKRQ